MNGGMQCVCGADGMEASCSLPPYGGTWAPMFALAAFLCMVLTSSPTAADDDDADDGDADAGDADDGEPLPRKSVHKA